MNITATVEVVDARDKTLKAAVNGELLKLRNFVVILENQEDADKLRKMVGYSPQKLERFSIYALSDVLEAQDYSMLLKLCGNCDLRFLEQLKIPANKPPGTKPIVLYCELRGIISEHNTLEEATRTLMEYLHKFNRIKLFPLAGIYQLTG
jgi:hypothetical protein